jgi:phosphoribosylaminoimidazolecarboxamide formyltransferase/IMP cyclohydrolase
MTKPLRALLSVSDKTGIVEFARGLCALGATVLSTGGTAKTLRAAGIEVTDVADVTEFPEIMDGRVKTLHPRIHGGLLGRGEQDAAVMAEHGIAKIDVLAVNLYPFEATVARPDCSFADAVENIDIGGPAMLRAAAKNHAHCAVVVDPDDYGAVLTQLREHNGAIPAALRRRLARKTFAHTASYDAAIYQYLDSQDSDGEYPARLPVGLTLQATLRYGENPHQTAALYAHGAPADGTLLAAQQLQGKPLSFNNIADANAALECVKALPAPGCVIVKHANPCGVALADSLEQAYQQAYACDPTSAFGGIIAFNRELDGATAAAIVAQQFVEVVIAPTVSAAAAEAFAAKPNVRLLACGAWPAVRPAGRILQPVEGGMLVQDKDIAEVQPSDLRVVTQRQPTPAELDDALLAWRVVRYVKSNAIVYARGNATLGIGAGQMSRIMSAQIAGQKAAEAGLDLHGAAMASDAFFPFRDGIDIAAKLGIEVVIQPGGSMRDAEVIAAADEHNMTMLFTGMRHFRH